MGDLKGISRVLVTGATGFLGGQLAKQLIKSGVSVLAIGRNETRCAAIKAMGCEVLRHDISLPFGHIGYGKVDAVVHCAALSSPFGKRQAFEQANIVGTKNVVALAALISVKRFVHISTPSVYFSFNDHLNIPEEMPLPKPVNHYARTKREAEQIVLSDTSLEPIILRPRGIYGPGDETLLPRLIRAASTRPLPLLRGGRARIDLTYVDDVVQAIITAIGAEQAAVNEIFNISGGEVLPIQQIVEDCCRLAGIHPRWRKIPLGPALLAARGMETLSLCLPGTPEPIVTRYSLGLFAYAQSLNISKAERILGWTPQVRFANGLERSFGIAA